jgi:hypothetical protein
MNFQEAERMYQDLRAQYSAGKLSNTDFEAEVSKLKVQDAEGRWWQIGVQSGDWYVHDGQKWTKSKPSMGSAAPLQPPAPAAEEVEPAAGGNTAKSAPKGKAPSKVTPRLLSVAPAGRGSGLPTPVLIGIVGVVALVGIGLVVAAYILLSGNGKSPTTTSKTPTTVAVVGPTGVRPTVPPPQTSISVTVPTIAPPPTATLAPTTAPLTITLPLTGTTGTTGTTPTASTPAAPRATATKKPATTATPAGPTPTKTLALAPGVYVTKVRTDPVQVVPGQSVTFYITFVNTSGAGGPTPWLVKVFRCEKDCTGDELRVNKSIGETPKSTANINGGTTEVAVGPWMAGGGGCNYVASPYYIDSATGQVVPFAPTTGVDRFYYNFKMCQ